MPFGDDTASVRSTASSVLSEVSNLVVGIHTTYCARVCHYEQRLRSQRAKVPAIIATKTKEELQVYILDLLKKLKLRDKRIEGKRL